MVKIVKMVTQNRTSVNCTDALFCGILLLVDQFRENYLVGYFAVLDNFQPCRRRFVNGAAYRI